MVSHVSGVSHVLHTQAVIWILFILSRLERESKYRSSFTLSSIN